MLATRRGGILVVVPALNAVLARRVRCTGSVLSGVTRHSPVCLAGVARLADTALVGEVHRLGWIVTATALAALARRDLF